MTGTVRMFAGICGVVLSLGLASSTYAAAYKWRDAQGNMHFSDTPPPSGDAASGQAVQEFSLSTDFADAKVSSKPPIPNPRTNLGPTIGFDHFVLKLDSAGSKGVTIGREFSGTNCSISRDVQWNDGIIDLKGRLSEAAIAERFRNFGYRFVGSNAADSEAAAALADLHMNAELLVFKYDVCRSVKVDNVFGTGSRAYVKLRWSLYRGDPNEPLYRGTSAGAYDGWRPGVDPKETILRAIAGAADNLLGDPEFVAQLGGDSTAHESAAFAQAVVKLAVAYGDGAGSFRGKSEKLLRSAVTVRTSRGHGSGVVIDARGYALTNAHVVGSDGQVEVMLDDSFIDARVLRTDRHADVALLQFDPHGHDAANVARVEPHPGDPLYVVGTPLSLKLSHTVTQGVLSAMREVDGARLYQTDAAVNPGNSGGPVFNEAGELVALSVSGVVNAEGASLNVNYLIPITRALTAVGAFAE